MSSTAEATGDLVGNESQGHPRGLYVLFGAEMWERFSYYGMRALLVLYLTKAMGRTDAQALEVYGIYTGLVYLTPLLGGFMADRYLGQRKAILIGGILMALGHFAMAFESLLSLALGLLILGNGFFKPNISTMVGQLYPQGDSRRDSAYTIFYMGINLGAFFSPWVCGTLGERVSWHLGFAAAGVGMVLGLLNFTFFQRLLGRSGYAPGAEHRLRSVDWFHVALISAIGAGAVVLALLPIGPVVARFEGALVRVVLLGYWVTLAVVYGVVIAAICKASGRGRPDGSPIERAEAGDVADVVEPGRGESEAPGAQPNPYAAPRADLKPAEGTPTDEPAAAEEEEERGPFTAAQWQRVGVIVIISLFSIVFWAGFEQSGGTLNLFADQKTDRTVLGDEPFPASWYQSVNPLLILLLAPALSVLWTTLDRTRFKINSAAKFGMGLILLSLGMCVIYLAESKVVYGPDGTVIGRVGPHWLLGVYFMFTVGELCLSPIGLSLVNKLAPARIASLAMAFWFMCTAGANYLAAMLHSLVAEDDPIQLWRFLIVFSLVPGILLLLMNPLLKKMSHGRI